MTAVTVCLCVGAVLWTVDLFHEREAKLTVKDKVGPYLVEALRDVTSIGEAKEYLREKLSLIRDIADPALEELGIGDRAEAVFCEEELAAGGYEPISPASAIAGDEGYETRSFFLDLLEKLEKLLRKE